jgi:manganese efflux pump family protein
LSFASLLVLALGLAMDAAAVSAARGMATTTLRLRDALVVGLTFGGFQGVMPILGWLLGSWIGPSVAGWDHWIAFVLLTGIGVKMLLEARAAPEARPLFGARVMLLLGVATSIDAFAAGITLPMLGAPLLASALVIGVATALLSAAGLVAGRRLGAMFGRRLDALGGVALILLGAKVLIEHLSAH